MNKLVNILVSCVFFWTMSNNCYAQHDFSKDSKTLLKGENNSYYDYSGHVVDQSPMNMDYDYHYIYNVNSKYFGVPHNYYKVQMNLPEVNVENPYSKEFIEKLRQYAKSKDAVIYAFPSVKLDGTIDDVYFLYSSFWFDYIPIELLEEWEYHLKNVTIASFTPNIRLHGANWFSFGIALHLDCVFKEKIVCAGE